MPHRPCFPAIRLGLRLAAGRAVKTNKAVELPLTGADGIGQFDYWTIEQPEGHAIVVWLKQDSVRGNQRQFGSDSTSFEEHP
jgi:hypothetical protein